MFTNALINQLNMSKKLLLLLITLITFNNVSYASFPVTKDIQTKNFEITTNPIVSDNSKILLYSLVPIPAAILGVILFSGGSVGFIFGVIMGAVAVFSAIYSLYLNFTTNIAFWDWKNYLAVITALVLGILALAWTVIIMAFGGIG